MGKMPMLQGKTLKVLEAMRRAFALLIALHTLCASHALTLSICLVLFSIFKPYQITNLAINPWKN
jgi:hypothetical protein